MADNNKAYIGSKIQATEIPQKEIGVDLSNQFMDNLIGQVLVDKVDLGRLQGFNQIARTREQQYQAIDTMAFDPTLASYLKTVTSDVTQPNDKGQIVWCEGKNEDIVKYVTYLLNQLDVDKNSFRWVFNLVKYGDLYLKLFRQSDVDDEDLFKKVQEDKGKSLNEELDFIDDEYGRYTAQEIEELEGYGTKRKTLNEDVNIVVHDKSDHYVHYVEEMPNPGEFFELQKRGKTQGFIKTSKTVVAKNGTQVNEFSLGFQTYNVNKSDVDIYGPTEFVHAVLNDISDRNPEEVNVFLNNNASEDTKDDRVASYRVKRGQGELATVFKVWRELSLLEDSVMLDRVTKSSIIRLIQVQVGTMPKEQIGAHLQSIKSIMEQNTALDTGEGMNNYNNPGPMVNNMYVPVRDQIGSITSTTVGGDVDPKQLTDLEWFNNKLFGALGVPKQHFGFTDDGAGFNGGQSLSILSSRYGKGVQRIQVAYLQALTTIINLYLYDKGFLSYINNFTLKMQEPITQEELDRRENKRNRIGVVTDIINTMGDISDQKIKLRILKSLLADVINDNEVIGYIQDQIDLLEKQEKPEENEDKEKPEPKGREFTSRPEPIGFTNDMTSEEGEEEFGNEENVEQVGGEEDYLPSPDEMGMNMIDNTPISNGEEQ